MLDGESVVGCASSRLGSAGERAQRGPGWDCLCEKVDEAEEATDRGNVLGARGRELAGVSIDPGTDYLMCFRHPHSTRSLAAALGALAFAMRRQQGQAALTARGCV
jgi:hypothetical protein